MSKQCLDIEQMRHLHELGINSSKASMCWAKFDGEQGYNILLPKDEELFEALVVINYIPTFTLQDILDILPKGYFKGRLHLECIIIH